jgi:quinol monooxygenase YgiN
MSEIHVFANVTAAAGNEDKLREVLTTLAHASQDEPGVVSYILHEDIKTPGNFYVFEAYKDQAAVDAHMGSAHLAAAFAAAGPLLSGAPSIVPTVAIAGA